MQKSFIIWCLCLVHSHQSYQSCNSLPTVFQRMLKTSPVVQQFHMKKGNSRYSLYPALKAKQQTKINLLPCFSLSFDESLNHQKCQM